MTTVAPSLASLEWRPGMASLADLLQRNAPAAEVLARLQSDPADAEAKDEYGRRPLHLALVNKHPPEVVTAVLAAQPDVAQVWRWRSPAAQGKTKRARNRSSDLLSPLRHLDNLYPLHLALVNKHPPEVVTAVLAAHPAAARITNRRGTYPLHYALSRKHTPEMVTMATAVLAAHPAAAIHTCSGGRAVPFRFGTLQGDAVDVQLKVPRPIPYRFDVMTELAAAAVAKLGVLREDIYIADGTVVLYRPAVTVTVVVLGADGAPRTAAAAAPIPVTLATECGPIGNANAATVPTTVSYAARKIAQAVFRIPGSKARSAIRLHVGDGAAGPDRGFRKLGGRDQGAVLAAAGIVDGAVLGVKARKSGWLRRRAELVVVASDRRGGGPRRRLRQTSVV